MKNIARKFVGFILQFTFGHLHISKNKIFLETGTGEAKDQVRALYDYIKQNHPGQYTFVWALKHGVDENGISRKEIVYKKSIGYYYNLLTSKYWLRTHSIETIVKKREKQVYIQLWHGPGATKKEGYDIKGVFNDGKVMPHAREWDFYIATDSDNRDYIKTALNLSIPRILLGSCRTDKLVNSDETKYLESRQAIGINSDELAILYAPTFREEDFHKEKINLDIKKLLNVDGIKLILRVHPEVKKKLVIEEYGDNVIDGSKFSDIFGLYVAADILVTDYSSVAIEYSLLKRPIVYYMYDLEDYIKNRDFYFNFLDNLAGPIAKTEEELIDIIKNIENISKDYEKQYQKYYNHYNGLNDGKVCERFYNMLKDEKFS